MQRSQTIKPGETYFSGTPDNVLEGESMLGQEFDYRRDSDFAEYKNRTSKYRVVRNIAGASLSGGRFVALSADGLHIDGYQYGHGTQFAVLDELVSTVADDDICLVQLAGVAGIYTKASSPGTVEAGAIISCTTGSGGTDTAAGRAVGLSTSPGYGRALDGWTNSDTNELVYVELFGMTLPLDDAAV